MYDENRVKTSTSAFAVFTELLQGSSAPLCSYLPALQERKTKHPSGTEINILVTLKQKQQRNPSSLVSNCQFNFAIFSKSLLNTVKVFIMGSAFFYNNYCAAETCPFSCLDSFQEENNIHKIRTPPSSLNL